MIRIMLLTLLLCCGSVTALQGQTAHVVRRYGDTLYARQRPAPLGEQRASLQRALIHNGKWLTAASVAAFTVLGATEHRRSRREWDALLTLCRSDQAACTVGSDGRYERPDAETLYQRSRSFDRRANKWLVGAQVSLIVTTALFIIDLNPGDGPENIPFPANRLEVGALNDAAAVGFRIPF